MKFEIEKIEGMILMILLIVVILIALIFEVKYFGLKNQYNNFQYRINQVEKGFTRWQIEMASEREAEAVRLERRIEQLQPRLDPNLRYLIVNAILRESKNFDLPPSLILHLIYEETSPKFNPLSKSKIGACGLMQVRYDIHFKEIPELAELKPEHLYRIDENIHFGSWILRNYINESGSLETALRKYVGNNNDYVRNIFRLMAEYEIQSK